MGVDLFVWGFFVWLFGRFFFVLLTYKICGLFPGKISRLIDSIIKLEGF